MQTFLWLHYLKCFPITRLKCLLPTLLLSSKPENRILYINSYVNLIVEIYLLTDLTYNNLIVISRERAISIGINSNNCFTFC